jgi:hypothetical protein
MREGFAGTIESEGTGRRERFVALARYAVGILESMAQRTEVVAVPVAEKTVVDPRLVPQLDLSPEELGSEKISEYFKAHGIVFANQTLSFHSFDGQPLEMPVGPALAAAVFYFKNDGKDLLVVFARLEGGNVTVRFDDGAYAGGPYDSDETGTPLYQSLE